MTKNPNSAQVGMVSRFEKLAGWALLAAAFGVFFDSLFVGSNGEGTIGLIPLYIGFPLGSIGLINLLYKQFGWRQALLAALGTTGILYLMGAYVTPSAPLGWIGGFFMATVSIYLPLPYRVNAIVWTAVGILGFPKIVAQGIGLFNEYTLFGLATAINGAYILWRKSSHRD